MNDVLKGLKEAITPQTKVDRKKELIFIFDTLKEKGRITTEDYLRCIDEIRIRYK